MTFNFCLETYDVVNLEIYLQSSAAAMTDRERKIGRNKFKYMNVSRTKRAFK